MDNANNKVDEIKKMLIDGVITVGDIQKILTEYKNYTSQAVEHKRFSLTTLLYYVGGGIIFMGILILVSQNWNSLSEMSKILLTLGSAFALFASGYFFKVEFKTKNISPVLFLISALLFPLGASVLSDTIGYQMTFGTQTIVSITSLVFVSLSYVLVCDSIYIFFSIIYATWVFVSLSGFIIDSNPYLTTTEFFYLRTVVVGLSYLFLGQHFIKNNHRKIASFLEWFGVIFMLGAFLGLTDSKLIFSFWWEVIYPFILGLVLYIGIRIKSTAYLTIGSLFCIIYILKITSEYFSNSFGWPIALVFAGILIIIIGFLNVYLRNKYFKIHQ